MEIAFQGTEENHMRGSEKPYTIQISSIDRTLWRHAYLWIIYPLLLLAAHGKALAQGSADNVVTKQLWLDFNPSVKVAERVTLYGAIGARTISPNTWSRYLITPSVKYDWPRMILKKYQFREELHGGIGIFFTDNKERVDRLEIRPFQGYSLSMPNRKRIVIKHFVKLEERFEMETDDWINTFGLRLRYTASITLRFQGDIWARGKGFYIPVSSEFFWNLKGTKQFNDKIRIVGGIGREFSTKWKAIFLFGYHYTKYTVEERYHTDDIMFRFRVYYKIN
jgi:hypothetical protein